MKRITKLLVVLSIFTIISCGNDKDDRITNRESYQETLSGSRYVNINNDLSTLWKEAWDTHGMELICSCSCEGDLAVRTILSRYQPNNYQNLSFEQMSCEQLNQIFKQECYYSDNTLFEVALLSTIETNVNLTADEKLLLNELLNDAKNGNVVRSKFETMWDNLPSQSTSNNAFSHIIIEVSLSIQDYINDTDVFDDPPQAFWTHLAGAIFGATVSLTSHIVIKGHLDGGEFLDAVGYGALGGAIRAI